MQILKFENINKGDLNKGDKTYDKLEKILEKSLSELQDIIFKFKFKKILKNKTVSGSNISDQQLLNDLNSSKSLEEKFESILSFETDDIKSIGYDSDKYYFTLCKNRNLYQLSKFYKKTENGWKIIDKLQTMKSTRTAKLVQPDSHPMTEYLFDCSKSQNESAQFEVESNSDLSVFESFSP